MVTRKDILKYTEENYNTLPEHLWAKNPNFEVLRHKHNQKWYALIMDIPRDKVGLEGNEVIDVMNIKCEPDMILSLSEQKGFCTAYHMNKKHWLTIILDGTVSDNEIYNLIDLSYELTN